MIIELKIVEKKYTNNKIFTTLYYKIFPFTKKILISEI